MPSIRRRLLLVPVLTLVVVGFLFNAQIAFHSQTSMFFPKTNIVFLKTHKCAGSSIQNILMRYGDTHHLNFVLPRTGNYLGHPAPFNRSMVNPSPQDFAYNIFAHHTRLDYDEIRAIMPYNSVFVTIIRDPIQLFESSFFYYGYDRVFKRDIHSFIKDLPRYRDSFLDKRLGGKFGANQMFFDLGGDPGAFRNETSILEYLDKLDAWFHLVLVAERMEESLVLLKGFMGWDVEDMITFKLNARNPNFTSKLNDAERERIQQLNHADVLLYNRFVERFDRQVENFGRERMAAETTELRKRTKDWYEFCVEDIQPHARVVTPKHYYNPRVMTFETKKNVKNDTCSTLTMEELFYTDYLRDRQMKEVPSSFKPLPKAVRVNYTNFKLRVTSKT